MAEKGKTSSLFDDIFKLQNTAPELDVDPEDLVDGFKASLVDGVDQVETFESSSLRRQAAIIPDDPKYKGKKTSRKDLDLNDDADEDHFSDSSEDKQSDESESGDDLSDEDDINDEDHSEDSDNKLGNDDGDEDDDSIDDAVQVNKNESAEDIKVSDDVLHSASKSDDRAKGKAVMYQLGVWDDLIKSRITLQKMVTSCNRLPQPDTWTDFLQHDSFRKEAKNVHSSVRKLVSTLLELQLQLLQTEDKSGKSKPQADGSDEEITSESEDEHNQEQGRTKNSHVNKSSGDGDSDSDIAAEEEGDNEEMETDTVTDNKHRGRVKRKLDVEEVEETIMKRHKDFQRFRNDTLTKWDEKTRLTRGKIKAKNFAAFEVSVLKQIEQVLVNRERLVKRLHQQRSAYRILGQQQGSQMDNRTGEDNVVDDDDDDVEIKLKQRTRQDPEVNQEIIDDNDFYHVCLRDLIEMKQNEETDPVMANKQWLEIQRLRNKQKRKVDTRASKGRKIRYHVKEKLKNYMTPYDKSLWSDEQKDDLFKALFGGRRYQDKTESFEKPTINLGI